MSKQKLPTYDKGMAGRLAEKFVTSKLTPLLAIASILLGIGAIILTPKEEEPQISVPMIDIITQNPGMEAKEIERNVTEPIERGVWGLQGVEYVYSTSMPHMSIVTARFKVGEPMENSLVKIHHKLLTIKNQLPKSVMPSQVKSYSIDDVPFLTLTFSSDQKSDYELRTLVAPLARELSSTPDLSRVEFLGGQKRTIRIVTNPDRMSREGVSLLSLAQAIKKSHSSMPVGKNWGKEKVLDIEVGGRISNKSQVESIAIGQRGGRIIQVKDVATVIDGPEALVRSSLLLDRNNQDGKSQRAVSIVFAKRTGTNIVDLAGKLIKRADRFATTLPSDIKMTIMRDYGKTAHQKTVELIEHLLIATFSVAALIALFMGLKASLIVVTAIPVTLALTLAIYYFMDYTLNRVTLFALIFSIGILVDDAIVVVENIERHLKADGFKNILKNIINAVSEVGNPTILATFTVIAAVLPMAFVRGLMGPYMRPIPVGASLAMILSLFVAFMVTPWAAAKLFKESDGKKHGGHGGHKDSWLDKIYRKTMDISLSSGLRSLIFGLFTVTLLGAATSMLYFKSVKVKMLPFDNKNEFQVLVDYQPSTPLLKGQHLSNQLAQEILKNKNVDKIQIYAGEPAPYSFSGMVKHTFMRYADYKNDLQIVLIDKHDRKKSSHVIIEELRPIIAAFGKRHNAITKVLEIPPGPPVLATMVAEIYGPDEEERKRVAKELVGIFNSEPSFVDVDYSFRPERNRLIYPYDQKSGGKLGLRSTTVGMLGRMIFSETPLITLDDISSPEPVAVTLSVDNKVRSGKRPFQKQVIPSFESGLGQVDAVISKPVVKQTEMRMRKNLKPVVYVMNELSGSEEAPVYGMLKIADKIKYPTQTADVPWDTTEPTIKWDGEWFITYEVFRDMGIAFAVVVILIYVLVVGQFKSFTVPLVILAPIPISLIGIFPAHWLAGAYFTATSMIGFIAGAGVIVRNSIILVDFIEHQMAAGMELKDAVINAGVLRFRPMLLVAAAVVVGSMVMLFDPIFQGLAISLMAGEIAATLLSRFAVPVLYFWAIGHARERMIRENA
jgi:multidrug efflux pump subunit AcrB